MKKLFITAIAVLAFIDAGFAEGKAVKSSVEAFGTPCSNGAAAGFNSVINRGGTRREAWETYYAVLWACQSGEMAQQQ